MLYLFNISFKRFNFILRFITIKFRFLTIYYTISISMIIMAIKLIKANFLEPIADKLTLVQTQNLVKIQPWEASGRELQIVAGGVR